MRPQLCQLFSYPSVIHLSVFLTVSSTPSPPPLGLDASPTLSGATPDCLPPLITLPPSPRPRCIPNSFGSHLTPSVVTFLDDGEVAVGRAARRMAVSHPATTYGSAKRVIGRSFLDPVVQQELGRLPYKVRGEKGGDPAGAGQAAV